MKVLAFLLFVFVRLCAANYRESYLELNLPHAPPQLDYRDYNCVTLIKDQGPICDDCWAFSAIATLESHWCLKRGRLLTLSEQQLIDCNRDSRLGSWGCRGGVQSSAYRYVIASGGIESDKSYPYQRENSVWRDFRCHFNRTRAVASVVDYVRVRAGNESYLRDVVATFGPVSASLNGALQSFKKYKGGIYSDEKCVPGKSHAVEIIGYGSENGTDYWICKNSWSKLWGEDGVIRIKRGVDMCGITGYLVFPIVGD